jgi:hypothetical protein
MKKVALQFTSIIELVDFTLAIDANKASTETMILLLICEISDEDIELAKNKFKANVVQLEDGNNYN